MAPPALHAVRRLRAPYQPWWVLLLSPDQPRRLVIFVHGFRGSALASWNEFPDSGMEGAWWLGSDMLFVGYDSLKDSIPGVASRLRRELPKLYPHLPLDLIEVDGQRARSTSDQPYEELVIVGHSLGGVIVRRALCDLAHKWCDDRAADPAAPRPALLDARLRLFSPASAGFRAAGWLGLVRASTVWGAANLQLRRSSVYTDLQPGSTFLVETRRRTERLIGLDRDEYAALRASILWANPDNVVLAERYDTDALDEPVDETTHSSVCKPNQTYRLPWEFVEAGL